MQKHKLTVLVNEGETKMPRNTAPLHPGEIWRRKNADLLHATIVLTHVKYPSLAFSEKNVENVLNMMYDQIVLLKEFDEICIDAVVYVLALLGSWGHLDPVPVEKREHKLTQGLKPLWFRPKS